MFHLNFWPLDTAPDSQSLFPAAQADTPAASAVFSGNGPGVEFETVG